MNNNMKILKPVHNYEQAHGEESNDTFNDS